MAVQEVPFDPFCQQFNKAPLYLFNVDMNDYNLLNIITHTGNVALTKFLGRIVTFREIRATFGWKFTPTEMSPSHLSDEILFPPTACEMKINEEGK